MKKEAKKLQKIEKKKVKKQLSDDEEEEEEEMDVSEVEDHQEDDSDDDEQEVGFTDENQSWLTPKGSNKRKRELSDDEGSLDDDDDDLNDEFGDVASSDNSDSSANDDDEDDDEDDEFPIEKASKKLAKKQKLIAQESEAEMKVNFAEKETFILPSGQELEVEASKAPDLQIIQNRIRDVIEVLKDFSNRRQEGKSREEYLDCLKRDLCGYYSYNEFMMEKLIQMFTVSEITEVLEANEVQRPVTIRANSLKTRRRDLAQALINRYYH